MKLSIIIVTWNVEKFVQNCLDSLYKGITSFSFEVIVVDNNSSDRTIKKLKERFPPVKLIQNESNRGFAKANNQGLKMMKGEFALLLNPDTTVKEGAIDKMVEFMESNKNIGILGCKILNPDGSLQGSAFPYPTLINDIILGFHSNLFFLGRFINRYYNRFLRLPNHPANVGWVSGACLMIRKKTIEDIGSLDERLFLFAEDLDWCLRAKKKGWKVMYLPSVCIVHFGGQSTKKSLEIKIWSYYFKRFYFAKKYRDTLSLLILKLTSFFELLAKMIIIRMKKRLDPGEKESRLKGYKKAIKLIFQRIE